MTKVRFKVEEKKREPQIVAKKIGASVVRSCRKLPGLCFVSSFLLMKVLLLRNAQGLLAAHPSRQQFIPIVIIK
jgi:hypothetical protein